MEQLGIHHLVQLLLEHGAKIQANSHTDFWTATTSIHVRGKARTQKPHTSKNFP
jgi:hypothetical protein